MSGAIVSHRVEQGVGVILVDNPPVNALNAALRKGIVDSVSALGRDDCANAIVVACAGRTFIAGADIGEFGKPRVPPSLADVCSVIEDSPKPVVAALHGTALGGGLELALSCQFRVADAQCQMGLPEVTLGLIPGAGGAARLTRIVGPLTALDLVQSGRRVSAAEAAELGLIDAMAAPGEPILDAALAFAHRALSEARAVARKLEFPAGEFDRETFERQAAALASRTAGQLAPAACIESVRRGMTMPLAQAVAADRQAFAELSAGTQSRALRHAFFAERQAAKLEGAAASADPYPIDSVAVLGAGTMGAGIAMCFAGAGVPVTLIDRDEEAVERGLARIRANYQRSVARGSIEAEAAEMRLALIRSSTDRAAAADADLVIEAVFEDLALKQEIFAELDRTCRPDALLATNTSALDLDAIAAGMSRRERFVGLHFFSPANVMKLLEIVRGADTGPVALATAVAIAKRIGKIPVVAGNCDGFIGNRMVARRGAQVDRLLLEGASPAEIDAAYRAFGFKMGPLETNDMSGLDVGYAIRKRRGTFFPVADAVAEAGRLGQKTGSGYYRYEQGSRTPIPDPDTDVLIRSVSDHLGVTRRTFTQDEMIDRLLLPIVNEGARILEEGIAARGSDIDVVWINGYGFPRWRGGPMFYADEVGIARVRDGLRLLASETGDASLEPAPLIQDLATAGGKLSSWQDGSGRSPQ